MKDYYSEKATYAFLILLATYVVMVLILLGVSWTEAITFSTDVKGDVLPLLVSLPFVALYLVILLAATAGYAQGAVMAKSLPFSRLLKNELQKRKMDRATIKTKIRSGSQVTADTPFLRALTNIVSSRLPILAVVDGDKKVTGVITTYDIIRKFQEETDKTDATDSLYDRLKSLTVEHLGPRQPVVATTDDNLQAVTNTMIREQFTKLIVVASREGKEFSGTVDVLDLVAEMVEGDAEE